MGQPSPTPSTFMAYVQNCVNSPRFNCDNLLPSKKRYADSLAVLLGVNTPDTIKTSQEFKENVWRNYGIGQRQGKNILVHKNSRKELLCWEDLEDVLKEYHDNGGHDGRDATVKKIQERFHHVPVNLVREYIRNCGICKIQGEPKEEPEPDFSPLRSQNYSLNHPQQTQMSFAVPGGFGTSEVKEECPTPPDDNEISEASLHSFGDDSIDSHNKENGVNRINFQVFGNNGIRDDESHADEESENDSEGNGEPDLDEDGEYDIEEDGQNDLDEDGEPGLSGDGEGDKEDGQDDFDENGQSHSDHEQGNQNSLKIKIVNVESQGSGPSRFQCMKVQTHPSPKGSEPSGSGNQTQRENNSNVQPGVSQFLQPDMPDRNIHCRPSLKQTLLNRQLAHSVAVAGLNQLQFDKLPQDDIIKLLRICDPEILIPEREVLEKNMDDLMLEIHAEVTKRLIATNTITFSFEIFDHDKFLAVFTTFYDTIQRRKTTIILAVLPRQEMLLKYEWMKQHFLLTNWLQERTTKSVRFVTDFCTEDERLFRDVSQYLHKLSGEKYYYPWLDRSYIQLFFQEPDFSVSGDQMHFLHPLLKCAERVVINSDAHSDIISGIGNIIGSIKRHANSVASLESLDIALTPIVKNRIYGRIWWKNIFMTLDSILTHRSKLTELGDAGVSKAVNDMNWTEAKKLHSFLQPFNSYTDLYGDESPSCVSEIVVIIRQLKTHLKEFEVSRNYTKTVTEMLSELDKQFDHIFNPLCRGKRPFDGVFLASTLLDPRFRKVLKIDEIRLAKQYITSLQTDQNSASDSTAANSQNEEPLTKKRKYGCLNEMKWEDIGPLKLEGELGSYIHNNSYDTQNDDLNPWKFWQDHATNFPKLAPIALDVLSVPLFLSAEECISLSKSDNYHVKPNESDKEFERRVLLTWNKSLLTI